MITIEFDRLLDARVDATLERLSKAVGNLQPTNDDIGAYLVGSTQRRFALQHGPDGTPWKPSIRAREESGQTLLKSRRLHDTIAHRATSDTIEVGSNLIYAGVHQLGATIHAKNVKNLKFRIGDRWISKPSVTIPARPFLGIDAEDIEEIDGIVMLHLQDAVDGKPA